MRKILIAGLVVLNIVLAFGVFATPAETRTAAAGLWPCCKGKGPDAFCCDGCCWFSWNCNSDSDCRDN